MMEKREQIELKVNFINEEWKFISIKDGWGNQSVTVKIHREQPVILCTWGDKQIRAFKKNSNFIQIPAWSDCWKVWLDVKEIYSEKICFNFYFEFLIKIEKVQQNKNNFSQTQTLSENLKKRKIHSSKKIKNGSFQKKRKKIEGKLGYHKNEHQFPKIFIKK